MAIELSRPVDKKLRAGVAGLEMEISDSVMDELLAALAERLQADSDDGAAGLLLMAMELLRKQELLLLIVKSLLSIRNFLLQSLEEAKIQTQELMV